MTGSIHIADAHGDTTRTWDTADPQTVREIEEVTLTTWKPDRDTELVVTPRLAGG
jgi:hypothetical protein